MNTKISKNRNIMRDLLPIIEVIIKTITIKTSTIKIVVISGQWKEKEKTSGTTNFIITKIKRTIISKIIFTEKLITDNRINSIIHQMKRISIMCRKISKASKYIRIFKILKLTNKTFFSK